MHGNKNGTLVQTTTKEMAVKLHSWTAILWWMAEESHNTIETKSNLQANQLSQLE